jgi:hypothetical protein
MSEYSEDKIYELFEKSGYFDLTNNGFESNFSEMVNALRKINDIPQISKSFVYVDKNNQILSGASIIKLYNYTFLAQHLAVKKDSKLNMTCKMDIYKAIQNYILNNDYFKYYLAYFDRDLGWHKGLFQKISDYVNNPQKFLFEELTWFVSWTTDGNFSETNTPYMVDELYDLDEFIDYADKNLSDIEKGCYCYDEDIHLDKIKSIYAVKGLYAERKIFRVTENDKLVAYLVVEAYTSGLNLFNCVDCAKIYFAHTDIDQDEFIKAVYNYLNSFYLKYNKKYFHIFTNSNCDIDFEDINIDNFTRVRAVRVIANNDGVREYKNYFKTFMK